MSAKRSRISSLKRVVLAVALLGYPCGMLAQHGGGSPGGGGLAGSAGGGGLSGPAGRATGVSEKDELKDFREVLAVQATSQQIVQYAAMVKISEAASAELRSFQERLDRIRRRAVPNLPVAVPLLTRRWNAHARKIRNFLTDFRSGRNPG